MSEQDPSSHPQHVECIPARVTAVAGLHASPAYAVYCALQPLQSVELTIHNQESGESADGRRPLSTIELLASKDTRCLLEVRGDDPESVRKACAVLLNLSDPTAGYGDSRIFTRTGPEEGTQPPESTRNA